MLKIESVSHRFPDGTQAINAVNLSLNSGEFCVLLGSSGAGKSTLMSMINGLISPSEGHLLFNDVRITRSNIRKLQQKVRMIHQQLHLVPRASVINNVISGKLDTIPTWRTLLQLFTMEDQRKACELLYQVNLEEQHLYRRASDLSGGQQQRVAIARAFMSSPEIVLADEPIASLDPTISHSVLKSLKDTSRQRKTTVLCSLHQVDFALEYADRIIALRKGSVVYDGTPNEMTDAILEQLYSQQSTHERKDESSIQPMLQAV